MKSTGWIDFTYKLPYVNVNGGDAPYDYPIIVALKDDIHLEPIKAYGIEYRHGGMYCYALMNASEATRIYQNDKFRRALMVAWTAFDGCTVQLR